VRYIVKKVGDRECFQIIDTQAFTSDVDDEKENVLVAEVYEESDAAIIAHLLSNVSSSAVDDGAIAIVTERMMHFIKHDFKDERDDTYVNNELVKAAQSYVLAAEFKLENPHHTGELSAPGWWPWDISTWKPSQDPVLMLVKAGSLLCAEIDRILRQRKKEAAKPVAESAP